MATSLPSYLINVKPVFRIESDIIGIGASIGMGEEASLHLNYISPNDIENDIREIIAGDYHAININPSVITGEILQKRIDKSNFSDMVGEMLYQIGLAYLGQVTLCMSTALINEETIIVKLEEGLVISYNINNPYKPVKINEINRKMWEYKSFFILKPFLVLPVLENRTELEVLDLEYFQHISKHSIAESSYIEQEGCIFAVWGKSILQNNLTYTPKIRQLINEIDILKISEQGKIKRIFRIEEEIYTLKLFENYIYYVKDDGVYLSKII